MAAISAVPARVLSRRVRERPLDSGLLADSTSETDAPTECPASRGRQPRRSRPHRRHHGMTRSALSSSGDGIDRPSCFAVSRLTTSSNLFGCSTGMSPGLAPQHPVDQPGRQPDLLLQRRAVREQRPGIGHLGTVCGNRDAVARRQAHQLVAQVERDRRTGDDRLDALADQRPECGRQLHRIGHRRLHQRDAEGPLQRGERLAIDLPARIFRVPEVAHHLHVRVDLAQHLHELRRQRVDHADRAGDVAARMTEAVHQTGSDRIGAGREDDRDRCGRAPGRTRRRRGRRIDQVRLSSDQLGRAARQHLLLVVAESPVVRDVPMLDPTQAAHLGEERLEGDQLLGPRARREDADGPGWPRLRPRTR